jgi:hypothetical protein
MDSTQTGIADFESNVMLKLVLHGENSTVHAQVTMAPTAVYRFRH